MPNLAVALKAEIARVARRGTKADIEALKKLLALQRRTLAELRTRADRVERSLRKIGSSAGDERRASESNKTPSEDSAQLRFSAKGFASLRQRLGVSAAAMGQLLGVSPLSVYKWESGKTRPRTKQIEKIASVRGLGKREVQRRLENGKGEDRTVKAVAKRSPKRGLSGGKRTAAAVI